MGLREKLKRLTEKVKVKPNIRYIEVDGICFAVGIDYIIELTKAYNERYNVDAGIDEVLKDCFGNAKVTATALEKIILALTVSVNLYRVAVNEQKVTSSYIEKLIDERGFGYIGTVIFNISALLTAMMLGGSGEKEDTEDNGKEKKS